MKYFGTMTYVIRGLLAVLLMSLSCVTLGAESFDDNLVCTLPHVSESLVRGDFMDYMLTTEIKVAKNNYSALVTESALFANRKQEQLVKGRTQEWIVSKYDGSLIGIQDGRCTNYSMAHVKHALQRLQLEDIFALNWANEKDRSWLGGLSMMRSTDRWNEMFISEKETVRGMPVDHWRTCIRSHEGITLYIDIYLNQLSKQLSERIPVRTVVERHATENGKQLVERYVYDSVMTSLTKSQPGTYYQIPRGLSCNASSYEFVQKPSPVTNQSFSATVLMVYPGLGFSTSRKQYFDQESRLTRFDTFIVPGLAKEKHGYFKIVHDYNTDIEYTIDMETGGCTMKPISNNRLFPFAGPWDPSHSLLKNGANMFDFDAFNLTYKGSGQFGGEFCHVYASHKVDWPKRGVNVSLETYYKQSRSILGVESGDHHILVGVWYNTTDRISQPLQSIPELTYVINYENNSPDFSLFDISTCYNNDQKRRLVFTVPVAYSDLAKYTIKSVKSQTRQYIANISGLEYIRITNLDLVIISDNEVDVWFTLLDVGTTKEDRKTVSLEDAVVSLQVLRSPLAILPAKGDQCLQGLVLKPSWLRTEGQMMGVSAIPIVGYTNVSMAIAAVLTLVVGINLSLAAVFYMWKKGISIPFCLD